MIFDIISDGLFKFKKNNLLETVDHLKLMMDESNTPVLSSVAQSMKTLEARGRFYMELQQVFASTTGYKNQDTWMDAWMTMNLHMRQNLNHLEDLIKRVVENESYSDSVTATKAQIILALSSMEFITKNTIGILSALVISAHQQVDKEVELTKGEHLEARNNANKLFTLLSDFGIPTDKFKKTFKDIPDAVVTKQNKNVVTETWGQKVDPFVKASASGFIPNIPLIVVDAISEFRLMLYTRDKYNKKQIENRVMYLQAKAGGDDTASIEKQIKHYQNEVSKLDDKIRDFEKKFGGE